MTSPANDKIAEIASKSTIFLHTMIEEHFGISIVEMMASGLIPVCHCSGGPESDIVGNSGRLCKDRNQFVSELIDIIHCNPDRLLEMRNDSRQHALRYFSDAGMGKIRELF